MTIRRPFFIDWILLPLAFLGFFDCAPGFAGQTTEERLRAEAPAALAELEAKLSNVECLGKSSLSVSGTTIRYGDYRIKVRDADTLIINAKISSDVAGPTRFPRLVNLINAKGVYLFREDLEGKVTSPYPDGAPPYPHHRETIEYQRRQWIDGLARGYFGGRRSLRALLEDPEFRITCVAEEERDGRAHVRVNFEHRYTQGKTLSVEQGSFLLAPHLHWAFREFESWVPPSPAGPPLARWEHDLSDSPDGIPVVRKVTYTGRSAGEAEWPYRMVLELDVWAYRDVPEREFRAETYRTPIK